MQPGPRKISRKREQRRQPNQSGRKEPERNPKSDRKGCAHMKMIDQIQRIRMCIQTYFNLYGAVPDVQVLREWLGTTCDDRILECLNQK